jgi:hypothetical protein
MKTAPPRKLKTIIGRAERINFPELGVSGLPAKIDTGAFRSSVWASDIQEADGKLTFALLDKQSPWYSGQKYTTDRFEIVEVENSFGHTEDRYSVYIKVQLGSRTVRSNFTLADRSQKTYPVLIGRKLLKRRYIVDVSEGQPIDDEEESAK